MSMANVVSLMHRVAHDAAEERKKLAEKSEGAARWRFNKNLNLLINPEVRCPGCEKWWPTSQMWLVNERAKIMERVWTLDGKRLPLYRIHPHVSSDTGEICTGDFESASQALVAGLNRYSYHNPVATYLRSLGDDCNYASEEQCNSCEDFYNIADMIKQYNGYWICKDCNSEESEEEDEPPKPCIECAAETGTNSNYCPDCCCADCVDDRAAEKAREEDEEDKKYVGE